MIPKPGILSICKHHTAARLAMRFQLSRIRINPNDLFAIFSQTVKHSGPNATHPDYQHMRSAKCQWLLIRVPIGTLKPPKKAFISLI
jgi:hypothetical protein